MTARRVIRWLPMLGAMGGIYFFSSLPGSSIHLPLFPGSDKLAHALAYAVLAGSVLAALNLAPGGPWRGYVLAFAISSLYGISDEIHQSFVPQRSADILDWLADSLGAALLLLVWRWRGGRVLQLCRSARAASRAK